MAQGQGTGRQVPGSSRRCQGKEKCSSPPRQRGLFLPKEDEVRGPGWYSMIRAGHAKYKIPSALVSAIAIAITGQSPSLIRDGCFCFHLPELLASPCLRSHSRCRQHFWNLLEGIQAGGCQALSSHQHPFGRASLLYLLSLFVPESSETRASNQK